MFDIHTHVGTHDPSGFSTTFDQLTSALSAVDARAAVFPMTEPDGYRAANDAVLDACSGRLVAFCRVAPHDDPAARLGGASRPVRRGSSCIRPATGSR